MYLEELFGLKDRVIIVTGGNRGIGQTVAEGLAKAGADIVIFSRTDASQTLELVKKAGRKAHSIFVDVNDEHGVDAAVEEVIKVFGKIDAVFNNAGICIHKDSREATVAEWRHVLDINLTGEYIVSRAVAKYLVGAKRKGSIVNMASMSGSIVNIPQWQASYNASKAGVIHMTRSLAVEWIPYGIRVNSISPGYIATPMSVDTPQDLKDAWEGLMPMKRMGTPEELVGGVIYLLSDASAYTNGADLIVDGAYTCI